MSDPEKVDEKKLEELMTGHRERMREEGAHGVSPPGASDLDYLDHEDDEDGE